MWKLSNPLLVLDGEIVAQTRTADIIMAGAMIGKRFARIAAKLERSAKMMLYLVSRDVVFMAVQINTISGGKNYSKQGVLQCFL